MGDNMQILDVRDLLFETCELMEVRREETECVDFCGDRSTPS